MLIALKSEHKVCPGIRFRPRIQSAFQARLRMSAPSPKVATENRHYHSAWHSLCCFHDVCLLLQQAQPFLATSHHVCRGLAGFKCKNKLKLCHVLCPLVQLATQYVHTTFYFIVVPMRHFLISDAAVRAPGAPSPPSGNVFFSKP